MFTAFGWVAIAILIIGVIVWIDDVFNEHRGAGGYICCCREGFDDGGRDDDDECAICGGSED